MFLRTLKIKFRICLRFLKDLFSGNLFLMHPTLTEKKDYPFTFSLSLKIINTEYSENKIHNLRIAVSRIQNIVLKPRQIFSYWNLIGNPSLQKGYLPGRTILDSQLSVDVGGGLCQLSGIIYYLSLQMGLNILERHPHSKDIYTEETRFTPLGSDASVVYGYKDLRIQNSLDQPLQMFFQIQTDSLEIFFSFPKKPERYKILFEEKREEKLCFINVKRKSEDSGREEFVSKDRYMVERK